MTNPFRRKRTPPLSDGERIWQMYLMQEEYIKANARMLEYIFRTVLR